MVDIVGAESQQGVELQALGAALREKCGSLERLISSKMGVVSAALSFHQNMKNVSAFGTLPQAIEVPFVVA